MFAKTRNKIAGTLAIVGGLLILLGGGTGMVGLLLELQDIVDNLMGGSNETIEKIFMGLIYIAALGGIAVIIGGVLVYKNVVIIGKIIIILGTGIGIIGLIIALVMSIYSQETSELIKWLTTSFLGIGVVLSLISQNLAKRPGLI
jgi:hypothetical protein